MDFSNVGATDDASLSSEEVRRRYQNLKVVIQNIQTAFQTGLAQVTQIMQQFAPQLPDEFTSAMRTSMGSLQSGVKRIVAQSADAMQTLDTPTTANNKRLAELEREKADWESQKAKGFSMLEELRQRNARLEADLVQANEQRRRWEDERAKGYQLMAEYKQTIEELRGGKPAPSPQLSDSQALLEEKNALESELETSHYAVERLQETVEELTRENKGIWQEMLQLKDDKDATLSERNGVLFGAQDIQAQAEVVRLNQLIERGKVAMAQLQGEKNTLEQENKDLKSQVSRQRSTMKAKGIKELFRKDTKSDWKQEDLNDLKGEMQAQMQAMKKQELAQMFDRQAAWINTEQHAEEAAPATTTPLQEQDEEEDADAAGEEEDFEAPQSFQRPDPKSRQSKVVRHHTQTSWQEPQLMALKEELMQEMQAMQKEQLAQMFAKQDALRLGNDEPEDEKEPATPNPTGQIPETPKPTHQHERTDLEEEQVQLLKSEMMAEMAKMHKASMQEMFQKGDELRWRQKDAPMTPRPPDRDAQPSGQGGGAAQAQSMQSRFLEEEVARKAVHRAANQSVVSEKTEEYLSSLKEEMMAEMAKMHKQSMQEMFEKGEELRWKEPRKTNLITEQVMHQVDESTIEDIRAGMMVELQEMTKKELARMMDKQMHLRTQSRSTVQPQATPNLSEADYAGDFETVAADVPQQTNLIRNNTETDWNDDELDKMQKEMLAAVNKQQKEELNRMFQRQEENTWANFEPTPGGPDDADTNVAAVRASEEEADIQINIRQATTEIHGTPPPESVSMAEAKPLPAPVAMEEMAEFQRFKQQVDQQIRDLRDRVTKVTQEKYDVERRLENAQNVASDYEKKIASLQQNSRDSKQEIRCLEDSKCAALVNASKEIDNLRRIIALLSRNGSLHFSRTQ